MKLTRLLIAGVALFALAGCGAERLARPDARGRLDQDEVLRRVSATQHSHCGPNPYTLEERLPNTTFVPSYGEEFSFSDVAVRGDITAVEEGVGFYTPPYDAPGDLQTDFDDRRSTWKTLHLTVRVAEVLAGEAPGEVRVGFKVDADMSIEEARDLRVVDDAVFLLSRDHVFFDYDPALLGSNADAIATIAADGELAPPVLGSADDQEWALAATPDFPSLAEAAARPQRRIERDLQGCG